MYGEEDPPPQTEQCTNSLCTRYRLQHGNMTQKCNELEKQLENARRQHNLIFNQVVTRGEALMLREAKTGQDGVRLPNGEILTAEKFIEKTILLNKCRDNMHKSEKKAKELSEENTKLKQENYTLFNNMRKFENMLNGFERARNFDVFTDEAHRATLEANSRLVEQVDTLSRELIEAQENGKVLKKRARDYKKCMLEAQKERQDSVAESTRIPRKRCLHQAKKRRISSDEGDANEST